MTIKVFQAGKGDCLLISNHTSNILVDGGVAEAYSTFVAQELEKLRNAGKVLDLACVSHIDDDHIGGFLKMIEDLVDWRVYDYQKKQGNTKIKAPNSPRPPEIKEIWHNAFHDLVQQNAGEIEDMLAASANILSASPNPVLKEMGDVAYSKGQAIQLSRRLQPAQLNIPLNASYQGKFVMNRKTATPITIGNLSIYVIAPFATDLNKLRKEWDDWLQKNKAQIKKIKDRVNRDIDYLANSTFPNISYNEALAEELEPFLLTQIELSTKKVLGKREKVTTPNLASIMFLIEERGKVVLMTGDGHWKDILKGLESIDRWSPDNGVHLNVLKVQHHGSEHNLSEEFCNTVTADTYIFCGNGEHQNPDLDVIKTIIDSRTTSPAITEQAGDKFTLVFNSSAQTSTEDENAKKHMEKVERLVKKEAQAHSNLKYIFAGKDEPFVSLKI